MKWPVILAMTIVMTFCLCGCASETRVSGSPDQWVRAKKFSVMVSFTQNRITIRNDSSEASSVLPMKIRGWYKMAGVKEITLNHADKDVLNPSDSMALSIPPFLQMDAAPQVQLPTEPSDELNRVEVELGTSRNRESVTINR